MSCPYVCPNKCEDLSGRLIQPTIPRGEPVLMIVGEAPGEDEDKQGRFFVGKSGQELSNYLDRVGIPRERCWITNVCKCRPPGNRDPKREEVENCSAVLLDELFTVQPRFIASVGRFATQFFLGDVNMEMVHGIPHRIEFPVNAVVIPVYHPAAGLHDTTNMSNIMADFISIKQAMQGVITVRRVGDHLTPPPFRLIYPDEDLEEFLWNSKVVAIDTETQNDWDTPWCLQFCPDPSAPGYIILASDTGLVAQFAKYMANPKVLCVIHNSLFDLKVLNIMGVHPARFTDTMVMAYLLQTEPQGLKPLAFRHLNVKMNDYEDVVGPRTQEMAMEYLIQVACREWPKLDPVVEIKAGKAKVRQPQTINQKVNRMLNDAAAGKEVDLFDRWHKTPMVDGRGMVEQHMGPMRKAYLKDVIPIEVAYQYAAADAWSTMQIYPILAKKIQALGLQGVLDRDIGVVPLVERMQSNGMPVNPDHFTRLRTQFTDEMEKVNADIQAMVGEIHPGSDPQVLDLMERLGLLRAKRKIVGGKEVVIRKKMVDAAALGLIEDKHPVVPLIMRYRALAKLVDSFIDTILEKKGKDNRIRTTLRITRVVTGRLASSSPNLMAIPTRTEDGRRIRGGFIATEGYSFVSNDYSQVEMRVVAHISQDPRMLEVFRNGIDIHSATASAMFRLPIEKLDEMKHRYPAKRVGFGILNMISAKKLVKEMNVGGAEGWTEQACQKLIDDWFDIYAGVGNYVEERKAEARRFGFVRDMFGRIRLCPEVMSVHKSIVEAGIRQSINAPIQSGAQGIIKQAMKELVPVCRDFGADVIKPMIQIHDDLLFECRDDMLLVVIPVIQNVMENCVILDVPLKVDSKVGKSWEGMKKWKK